MGIIRTALIGAAIYGAVKYLTKKDELTGRSMVDDIKDQAPEWLEKVKGYKEGFSERVQYADGRYGE